MGNQETELGWSLKNDRTTETGKRAVPRQREKQLKAARESDHLIVLRDGRADHMGKGVTVICSLQRQLAPDSVGPEPVEPTFLQALSMKAKSAKAHRFQNLYSSLNEALLYEAWGNLNKKGAPGVDKVTIAEYAKNLGENIKRLVERLKGNDYRSRLIRRKYIPKGNGKQRPLGIPVVEDRLLQGAARLMLEAIFEQDLYQEVMGHFGKTVIQAKSKYKEFIAQGIGDGRREDLTGGGLIRSAGGWGCSQGTAGISSLCKKRRAYLGRW